MANPSTDVVFSCRTFHLDGSVLVVLAGELDLKTAPQLERAVGALVRRYDADQVTFDCSELTFIDAFAIGRLAAAIRRFGHTGRPTIRCASAWIQMLLAITETDRLFQT